MIIDNMYFNDSTNGKTKQVLCVHVDKFGKNGKTSNK